MKGIQRFELIDRIGRELQSRMSYSDIDLYLAGHGVDVTKPTSEVNSKWVHVKELLADAPIETVVAIADELEVPHQFVVTPAAEAVESSFWLPGHFRLFLSHLAVFKRTAGALRNSLREFGISAFVAHADIEPTKEWQREIENALFSMDGLAAILMPGFKESNWTDQEVGVAIGRNVVVVPIMKGLTPYGLMGKYQGFTVREAMTVGEVAESIFRILVASPRTRSRILSCLIDTTVTAVDLPLVRRRLIILTDLDDLPSGFVDKLRSGLSENTGVLDDEETRAVADACLKRHGAQPLPRKVPFGLLEPDDDLPF